MKRIVLILLSLITISGLTETAYSYTNASIFSLYKENKDIYKTLDEKINKDIDNEKYNNALQNCKILEKNAITNKSIYWLNISYYYEGLITKELDDYNSSLTYFFKIITNNSNPLKDDNYKMFQIYRHIGGAYKNLNKYSEALIYYKRSLQYNINDNKILKIIYVNMAIIYSSQNDYINAKKYYLKSLDLIKKDVDDRMASIVYNNLGNDEYAQGNFTSAIQYYIQSIQLVEKTNDTQGLAYAYNNLGNIYADGIKDLNKAYTYYTKSLAIEQKNKNNDGIAQELNNIGYILKLQLKYKDAELKHLQALTIFKKLNNNEGIIKSLENLGDLYSKLGNFKKSIFYFNQCIEYKKHSNEKKNLVSIYNNLAFLYLHHNDNLNAIKYFMLSLENMKIINDKPLLKNIYSGIHEAYANLGVYDKAYYYTQRYTSLNDSLLNENISKQIIEIQEKYEKNKMEQMVALQNMELKNKALQRKIMLGAMTLLIFVFSSVIYFIVHKRRNEKLLYERNTKLKEIEIKNLIQHSEIRAMVSMAEGQENERQRISRELHDRVGSMLSLVKLNLNNNADENLPYIKENIALLDKTYQEVRSISHNLYSGILRTFGLKVALQDLKKTVEAHNNIRFNLLFHDENFILPNKIEEVIYRVIQELVTNILKHANAKCIDIQINNSEEGIVIVTVEDDGVGFDTQIKENEGIGLKNIKYRLESVGGSLEINSSLGNGACFLLCLPLVMDNNATLV